MHSLESTSGLGCTFTGVRESAQLSVPTESLIHDRHSTCVLEKGTPRTRVEPQETPTLVGQQGKAEPAGGSENRDERHRGSTAGQNEGKEITSLWLKITGRCLRRVKWSQGQEMATKFGSQKITKDLGLGCTLWVSGSIGI